MAVPADLQIGRQFRDVEGDIVQPFVVQETFDVFLEDRVVLVDGQIFVDRVDEDDEMREESDGVLVRYGLLSGEAGGDELDMVDESWGD